jgi:hypothetical protein
MTVEDNNTSSTPKNSNITLHPNLALWINTECARIAKLVREIANENANPKKNYVHPDYPVAAHITEKDIIGDVVVSEVDIKGELVARYYRNDGKKLKLNSKGLADAKKTAEKIWLKPELKDVISYKTLLELLLVQVGKILLNDVSKTLSEIITEKIHEEAKELTVWIPIDNLIIEGELEFATSVLEMLSREKLNILWRSIARFNSPDTEPLRTEIESAWLGRGIMRFKIFSEPQRAKEIALERATDYMTLLNFYTPSARILSLASHSAPRGQRPQLKEECIVYGLDMFKSHKGYTEQSHLLRINYEILEELKTAGFITLSNLAAQTNCAYEKDLLNSLLVYGRACYQLEPMDKLLQIMTSLEMFCLRSESEPIQSVLSDRLAFFIATDVEDRKEIASNLRKTYKIRSGGTHHGKSIISDTEVVEQFFLHAWMFFLNALRCVGHYQSRDQFLNKLDEIKYT